MKLICPCGKKYEKLSSLIKHQFRCKSYWKREIINSFAIVGFVVVLSVFFLWLGLHFSWTKNPVLINLVGKPIYELSETFFVAMIDNLEEEIQDFPFNNKIESFFEEVNKSCSEDDYCFVNEVKYHLNDSLVYDYDENDEVLCRDYSITFCALMKRRGIKCYIALTSNHVLNLVELGERQFFLIDSFNKIPLIKDFLIVNLNSNNDI